MRRVLPLLLTLAVLTACASLAAAARAVDVTTVLPARSATFRAFHADSAAPPESTTFLEFLGVCPASDCTSGRPICNTDSITATVGGILPSPCFAIRSVDLYYPPIMSIRPFAPWVRVVVEDDRPCAGRVCIETTVPWTAKVTMAPLPEGPYSLDLVVQVASCGDTVPPPASPQYHMPFAVTACESLPPPFGCYLEEWQHSSSGTCDATVAPDHPAQLQFLLHNSVALAGLQGRFALVPPGLAIAHIEAVGPAAGMRLAWAASDSGARFVLFSTDSAMIPPSPLGNESPAVLRVTVEQRASVAAPAETRVLATELLASTPDGRQVPPCPTLAADGSPLRFVQPFALVCAAGGCDFNGDGFTDVRDLVLMVHCVLSPAGCAGVFDCNTDGVTNIDDVLCCAWKILRVPPCTTGSGCDPDTAPPRKDAAVRVTVGLPVVDASGVRVPIHIAGADRVGAARLAMTFPGDRWRVAGLDSPDPNWLTLAGAEGAQVVMGAIRIGAAAGPGGLDLVLRLQPTGPAPGGGEIGTLQADLSATDGVRLAVPVVGPAQPLPGNAVIELSANRPDPFSGETRFTLSVPIASKVDLAVFDLNGRRIATLHRGALAAGVTEFGWDGHTDGGAHVGAGVYFYRAGIDGRTLSRRMVYLGGN